MATDDLRGFLKECEEHDDLEKVEGAHWDLEIGTISELSAEKRGPAFLFDSIKDYPAGYRVATNLFTSKERMATAFHFPREIEKLEFIKKLRGTEYNRVEPVEVDSGPVMQNALFGDDVDLFKFPVPKYHEHDGGRYMGTGHIVIMRDPDEGYINAGVERAILHDRNTLGLYISPGKHNRIIRQKYWSKGQSCPVVMTFGPPPILYLAAALHVPWGISEFDWAGWMRNRPIRVIKGKITGIPFPADDEIVIEGEYLLPETEMRKKVPLESGLDTTRAVGSLNPSFELRRSIIEMIPSCQGYFL